jgi:hypothetical protein
MMNSLLGKLFGCTHKRTTFPFTPAGRSGRSCGAHKRTYIVCLACGKEFDYSWAEMRVCEPVDTASASPATAQTEQIAAH